MTHRDRAFDPITLEVLRNALEATAQEMGGVLKLDVGNSLWSREPVFGELFSRLPLTVELGLMSSVISLFIAIPTGIIAAVKPA